MKKEKIKLIYIISDIDRAIAFEWVVENIDRSKFELEFVLINSSESYFKNYLSKKAVPFYLVEAKSKKQYPAALLSLINHLRKSKADMVHTHLFTASLLGLTAARICGIKKRIHTRHHASQHHMYHPNAIKYDRWINFISTKIIAITENVKNILIQQEGVKKDKIVIVHHGFDLDFFSSVSADRIQAIKNKYNASQQYPIIGVVSRYTWWKGVQHIIPAFKKLLVDFPNAKLVLANTNGNDALRIKELLKQIPSTNFLEVEFEYDNAALYHLFDVFVHVPINAHAEAFGQTYVEALAAGIPSVFTLSGIAHDFIVDKKNAVVVDYEKEEEIYDGMKLILQNKELKSTLIKNGLNEDNQKYSLKTMISELEKIYLEK